MDRDSFRQTNVEPGKKKEALIRPLGKMFTFFFFWATGAKSQLAATSAPVCSVGHHLDPFLKLKGNLESAFCYSRGRLTSFVWGGGGHFCPFNRDWG